MGTKSLGMLRDGKVKQHPSESEYQCGREEQHKELIQALEVKCMESEPVLQLVYTSKLYRKHILKVNV